MNYNNPKHAKVECPDNGSKTIANTNMEHQTAFQSLVGQFIKAGTPFEPMAINFAYYPEPGCFFEFAILGLLINFKMIRRYGQIHLRNHS